MRVRFVILLLALSLAAASACGRRATSEGPDRERAYRLNNRGVALLERFDYAAAAATFRRALQVDNSLAIGRVNLSLALLYAPDLQGAAREASEAARLLPSAPEPPYVLGLIARAENRTTDALREFERVRQLDPDDVGARVNLGQIYLELRQYAEAIAILRPAVAAEPYNVSAAYNLGLALTRNGLGAEGQAILERVQTLRTTGYALTYGTGYLEQGRYAEALASTGAEPGLVDAVEPATSFTSSPIGSDVRAASAPSPFARRFTAADLTPSGARALALGLGGGVALIDFDGDGDADLFSASAEGERVYRNDSGGRWVDVTAASGLGATTADGPPVGCVAADYDNDGNADLFVLRYGTSNLYRNDGLGHFRDVTRAAGIPPYPFLPGAAAFVDVDHDGDLDLVIAGLADLVATRRLADGRTLGFPRDFAPAPLVLLRNNGNQTFTDTTADAHLRIATHAIAIVPTDFDNRRDVDLLIVNRDAPPLLFQNLRDGTFRDVAAETGLAAAVGRDEDVTAVAAGDVNKDEAPDFFFAKADGSVFGLSNGRGRFSIVPAPDGARASVGSQLMDYDNDGLLDLLTWAGSGPRVFRNGGPRWTDVTARAIGSAAVPASLASARGLAVADLNGDGAEDFVALGAGSPALWRNSGTSGRSSLRVALKGRVSNRLGIGSKLQVRAGALSARFETSAATPAVAPNDLVVGLGDRPGADAIRVLWPSGILQAETAQEGAASGLPVAAALPTLASPLVVEELNRKPSSCPFLFTWNGERFEFVTDFMGGGEMGYWESPGVRNTPDPLEYVRITSDQLKVKNGRLELRVTNELEETLFADRMQLVAIAHPRGIEIYPNEGMTEPPKPFRVFAVAGERVPRATDDHGHDVTDRIAHFDRRYPDDFALERFRGYAAPHTLTLDLAPVGVSSVLLLTGWTDYAFSSDNLAAHQAGLSLSLPSLQVKDAAGRWRTAIADIGIPVGRPQTIPIDLAGRLQPGEHEVRVVTSMRIYWDRALVATAVQPAGTHTVTLDPLTATLGERGFSAEITPGEEPLTYTYERASLASPWKALIGRYTRFGDVRDLLLRTDDKFVIAGPGDEIALSFDAGAAGDVPEGWSRTFLLKADGFSKEMDLNSASPDAVEPLPFHAMTRYPYRPPEHYPDLVEYQHYQTAYNTRRVARAVPSIDALGSR